MSSQASCTTLDQAGTEQSNAKEIHRVDEPAYTVLFVDDEQAVLESLQAVFRKNRYRVLTALSAKKALQVMKNEEVHLVVSDHHMPGMSGARLLEEIKERWPETIRIMLTGEREVHSVMGAVDRGVLYKFITKPCKPEELKLAVRLALKQYALMQENQELKEANRKQQFKIMNYSAVMKENRAFLGYILDKAGLVDREKYDWAVSARKADETISESLVRLGVTTESEIIEILKSYLDLEYVDLREMKLSPATVKFLPRDLCRKNRLIPIKLDTNQLTLAMEDPSDIHMCDSISLMTGLKIHPVIARGSTVLQQLEEIYGDSGPDVDADFETESVDALDIRFGENSADVSVQQLIDSSDVPPVVRIVNLIISAAVECGASDVHIEPKDSHTTVRYRIDGILIDRTSIPAELHPVVVSRIKILSKIDIAERRKPQDGRIQVKTGSRMIDIRVSSMPTIHGEKMVLRILDKSASVKKLGSLGVLPGDLAKIHNLKRIPQGMVISTGPTGSGKTTTLYSLLKEMLESSRSFQTIEDPVEYFLNGVSHVHVLEKIGLSFASVLRATLRQDPDVILVGEIRDLDTADVAFRAALTGHMVLSTLHTNNTIASITRLMDLGIKPYLIASALEGIVAQRLVRRICGHCKTETPPDPELLELLKISPDYLDGGVYRGEGCDQCGNTGYSGRTGIFEIFVMNEDFRHFICDGYKEAELMELARGCGMRTLARDGAEKVKLGMTTLEELLRVMGPQIKHERLCMRCQQSIDAKFLYCPHCGDLKQAACASCKLPMEKNWSNCVFCGEPRARSVL